MFVDVINRAENLETLCLARRIVRLMRAQDSLDSLKEIRELAQGGQWRSSRRSSRTSAIKNPAVLTQLHGRNPPRALDYHGYSDCRLGCLDGSERFAIELTSSGL